VDRHELFKLAVGAVGAAVARETLAAIIRHSPRLAKRLKGIGATLLKQHWPLFLISVDTLFIVAGIVFIVMFINDNSPATKGFVASMAAFVLLIIVSGHGLLHNIDLYVRVLQAPKVASRR